MKQIPEPNRKLVEKLTEQVFELRGQDEMIEILEAVKTVVTQNAIVPEGFTIGNAIAYGIKLQNRVIGEYFCQLFEDDNEVDFSIEATHASLMQPEAELGDFESLDLSEEISEAKSDWSHVPPPDDMHIAMKDSEYRGPASYCPNCNEACLHEFGHQHSGRFTCANCDYEVEI